MVQIALPQRPINHLKPVQQSKKQMVRAYCPSKYTVILVVVLQIVRENLFQLFEVRSES